MSEKFFLGEVKKCQKMDQKSVKMSENFLGLKFRILVNIHHGNILTFLFMGQFSEIFTPEAKNLEYLNFLTFF